MEKPENDCSGSCLNEEAFVALVVRYERRVRAFIKSLCPLKLEVDDLMQEVSVVAWQKFRSFRYGGESPDEQFVRWLCTIAKYQVLNERKKILSKKLPVPFDESLIEDLSALQMEHSSFYDDRRQALANCLNKLTGPERELIRQRYGLGEPVSKIAIVLQREQVTVYQAIARLRSQLLKCVQLTLKREGGE